MNSSQETIEFINWLSENRDEESRQEMLDTLSDDQKDELILGLCKSLDFNNNVTNSVLDT